jgi:AbrB family looped-hinge helix DNA binding protein
MPSATITSKGQVTIPRRIREMLRLEPGDRIDFVIDDGGRVVVRAGTADVGALRGLLHRPGEPAVSLDQMEAAIARQHRPHRRKR